MKTGLYLAVFMLFYVHYVTVEGSVTGTLPDKRKCRDDEECGWFEAPDYKTYFLTNKDCRCAVETNLVCGLVKSKNDEVHSIPDTEPTRYGKKGFCKNRRVNNDIREVRKENKPRDVIFG